MESVLEICNLNYQQFQNINISFNRDTFYSIIGANSSGKTTLFRILSGLSLTDDVIVCQEIFLNKKSRYQYLKKIGIVKNVMEQSFFCQTVYQEMAYPLINLGYFLAKREKLINDMLSFFKEDELKSKTIRELTLVQKQKLLLMISLLHQPKVLLIDNALDIFNDKERENIIHLLHQKGLCVINFTSKIASVYLEKTVILLKSNGLKEIDSKILYQDDNEIIKMHLELPFLVDLNGKLKLYKVLDNDYFLLKDMVNAIWP